MDKRMINTSNRSSPRSRRVRSVVSFKSDVDERIISARSPDGLRNGEIMRLDIDQREASTLGNPWVVDHPALRQLSTNTTANRKKSPFNVPVGQKIFKQDVKIATDPEDGYRASSISPVGKYTILPHIGNDGGEWTDVSYTTARTNALRKAASASSAFTAPVCDEAGAIVNIEEHVVYGNTNNLPPLPTKTVKMYLSSGYSDMKEERFAIHKMVVPKLRSFCKNLGLDFQLVDLHYGKGEELAEELTTYAVNQHEIDSCRHVSIGPAFMALIGNKYGSAIFPPMIEAEELELLLNYTDTECVPILEHWYRLDDNAVPPVYMLRLYESTDEGEDSYVFRDTLWMVPELLYMAAFAAHQEGLLSDVRAGYYKKSDLEEDIDKGLNAMEDATKRCLIYLRDLKGLKTNLNKDFEKARDFLDVDEDYRTLEQGSCALLQQLRTKIIPEHLSQHSIRTYSLPWCGGGIEPTTQVEHTNYMYQLCMDMETNTRWLIQEALTRLSTSPTKTLSSNAKEILQHTLHANTKIAQAVERKSILGEVKGHLRSALNLDYGANSGHVPIVLYGAQGIGKTTVMALAHHRIPEWFGSDCVRVTRFAGLTPKSWNLHDMLLSICEQISVIYDIHLPRDLDQKPIIKVAATFHKLLKKVSDLPLAFKRPLFIMLSSLDKLSKLYNAHNPAWLPHTLPPHVYIVVSVTEKNHSLYTRLRTLLKKADTFVRLEGFSPASAARFIDVYMSHNARTLTSEQRQTVVNMSHHALYSPMYMTLILSQAKTWNSLFVPSDLELGKTIPLAIEHIFDSLLEKHGNTFVSYALGYITVSKGGLTDTEVEDVVSCNDTVLSEMVQFETPPAGKIVRLPSLLWCRLKYDLQRYVVEHQRDGKTVMFWSHDIFVTVAHDKLIQPMWESKLHRGLLELYSADTPIRRTLTLKHGSVHTIENADRHITLQPLDVTNIRKLRVWPYHMQKAGSFEKVQHRLKSKILCNYDFLSIKLKALGLKEVLEDFTSLERTDAELTAVHEALQQLQQYKNREDRVANLATMLVSKLSPVNEKHSGLVPLVTKAKMACKAKKDKDATPLASSRTPRK